MDIQVKELFEARWIFTNSVLPSSHLMIITTFLGDENKMICLENALHNYLFAFGDVLCTQFLSIRQQHTSLSSAKSCCSETM